MALSQVGGDEGVQGTTILGVSLTPEEVGRRIARAREAKKPKPWSQFDLALALEVSPSTIYRWEKGKLPAVHELIRAADALDQPLGYLTEPPERLTELADVKHQVDDCLVRLEELQALVVAFRAEMEQGRLIYTETLKGIRAGIESIDRQLSEASPANSAEVRRDQA